MWCILCTLDVMSTERSPPNVSVQGIQTFLKQLLSTFFLATKGMFLLKVSTNYTQRLRKQLLSFAKCTLRVSCREVEWLIHHSELDLISRASTEIRTNIFFACGCQKKRQSDFWFSSLWLQYFLKWICNLQQHIAVSIIWLVSLFCSYCSAQ